MEANRTCRNKYLHGPMTPLQFNGEKKVISTVCNESKENGDSHFMSHTKIKS